MSGQLQVGDEIPSFTGLDQEGVEISNEDLIGTCAVLYFYPKDDTPGCTAQACALRDQVHLWEKLDAVIIGISPDNIDSHNRFANKYQLNFVLLADETKEICRRFGVLKKGPNSSEQVERTTFIVSPNGVIKWIERPVNVQGHDERIAQALENMAQQGAY